MPQHRVHARRKLWQIAMLLQTIRTPAVRRFATDYMSCQPGMYARFADPPKALRDQLAASVVDGDFATTARRPDAGHWMAIGPADLVAREHCPVWLVCDLRPSVVWPGVLDISVRGGRCRVKARCGPLGARCAVVEEVATDQEKATRGTRSARAELQALDTTAGQLVGPRR